MKTCIQCKSEVDFLSDNYTMYQVDGNRYLYCEACKSPKDPCISPGELSVAKSESESFKKALTKARKNSLILLVLSCLIGYYLGSQ